MFSHLFITGFYASLLALVLLGLSFKIIKLRFKFQVGLGDGEQKPLVKAIRIHGNFIEYMPLALLLLGIYEINGGDEVWLHLIGITLVIGRLLHAMGISKSIGASKPRQIGMLSTFFVLFALAILNILAFVNQL